MIANEGGVVNHHNASNVLYAIELKGLYLWIFFCLPCLRQKAEFVYRYTSLLSFYSCLESLRSMFLKISKAR